MTSAPQTDQAQEKSSIPQSTYISLKDLASVMNFSQKEQVEFVANFEKTLHSGFVVAMVKKLPKQERESVAQLLIVKSDADYKVLRKKLLYWFNEREVERLWLKQSRQLFADFLEAVNEDATPEQKKQLEKKFKPEMLRGIT